jgi:hypothetical protein
MQQSDTCTYVRPLQFPDDQIDCPECGPGMIARLVIRESSSGIAVASCVGCRKLYPVEMTGWRTKQEA